MLWRTETAAGGSGLSTLPRGQTMSSGRRIPSFAVIDGIGHRAERVDDGRPGCSPTAR